MFQKKWILLFFTFCFLTQSYGQTEKIGIAILPPTYSNSSWAGSNISAIWETVTDAFVKTKRFKIVDRQKTQAIFNERYQNASEEFNNTTIAEQGASIGAQLMVTTHIQAINAENMTYQDSQTKKTESNGYKANISIVIKLIDVATQEITNSRTIELQGGSKLASTIKQHDTPQSAIDAGIKKISKQIDKFVGEEFPAAFLIAEISSAKGGKAIEVLVGGGTEFGLKKGDKLKVIEITKVNMGGKTMNRKKEIGELKISNVEDENFSSCRVIKGGEIINTKFTDGVSLQVITLK